jgi:uncharacterized membrane protein
MSAQTIEIFGVVAIFTMVTAYALESHVQKSNVQSCTRIFIAVFAASCAAAAVYAYLTGAVPFMVAEAIWCLVAVRRWHMHGADTEPER